MCGEGTVRTAKFTSLSLWCSLFLLRRAPPEVIRPTRCKARGPVRGKPRRPVAVKVPYGLLDLSCQKRWSFTSLVHDLGLRWCTSSARPLVPSCMLWRKSAVILSSAGRRLHCANINVESVRCLLCCDCRSAIESFARAQRDSGWVVLSEIIILSSGCLPLKVNLCWSGRVPSLTCILLLMFSTVSDFSTSNVIVFSSQLFHEYRERRSSLLERVQNV